MVMTFSIFLLFSACRNLYHFPNNDGNKCTWSARYNSQGTRLLCRENRQIVIHDIPFARPAISSSDADGGNNKVRLTTPAAQEAAAEDIPFDGPPRTSANCFAGKDDELVAVSASDGKLYIWSVLDGRGERTNDQPLLVIPHENRYTRCVRYSPQNCLLASCGPYSTVIEMWTPFNLTRQTEAEARAAPAAFIPGNYRTSRFSPVDSSSSSSSTDEDDDDNN
jgi:hypothetical protein